MPINFVKPYASPNWRTAWVLRRKGMRGRRVERGAASKAYRLRT